MLQMFELPTIAVPMDEGTPAKKSGSKKSQRTAKVVSQAIKDSWGGEPITHFVTLASYTVNTNKGRQVIRQPMVLPYTEVQWQRRLERLAHQQLKEKKNEAA